MTQQLELATHAADQGRFDAAINLCDQIPPSRVDYALGRSLVASVYRQVGRHDLAEPFDEAGLAAALPDPCGRTMCRLGLVADRIGAGDIPGARGLQAAAEEALVGQVPEHWAQRWFDPLVTHAWVAAELALLCDKPATAVAVLRPFADRPAGVPNTRWNFAQAKTLLFLGVAQRGCGARDEAIASLSASARIATGAALAALIGPAVEQLEQLDPSSAAQWSAAAATARDHLDRHRPRGL